MTTTTIQAPGAGGDGFSTTAGNDGTLTIAVGPTGAKVNALVFDATGRASMPQNVVAFSAYQSVTQSGLTSGAFVKCSINTKEFDTASAFDNVTNYRFTPQVSGYYQISGSCYLTATNLTAAQANIYKNGAIYKSGASLNVTTSGSVLETSTLVYLNGSTDYVEFYAYAGTSAGTWTINTNQNLTWFQGILVAKA